MPSPFEPCPPPESALARYRLLSPTAGVHVSPIQLGGMSIGDQWVELGMGSMDKESSFKLLDAFFDHGGNFIDTANVYQNGSSERIIGEWAEKRRRRNEKEKLVCAALEKVAAEVGTQSVTAVAIAYLMQKTPYVFPIIGGRKVEHLIQNIEALDISLSDEQIKHLESVVPFDPGFPAYIIGAGMHYIPEFTATANFDKMPALQPIRPSLKSAST
ncbi:Aryl-alcohol dehydrogenase [NADP(+)] [Psilocybe cubensis]|uniref:Aryl-alcohol dehydrogenase [NADP(+)] n=1 Tax=Psilocybe cubensis TaxID=181762 RepID=A0ACB8GXE2_PSICU|nr:Aryl-alcohol dehydrogenase [NADP(+)] [Psilocybe cubensis]KAH9480241.1 Aryl-alcohol dehydrogenase [NADP(+)] [Psilocybe cubensis]